MSNAINSFIFYQLRDLLDQTGFIYHKRKLCNNNTILTVCHGFDIGHRTHADLAPAGSVCFIDTGSTKNLRTCREIRSFYNIKDFIDGGISVLFYPVINDLHNSTNNLTKIVRRNVGCHTNCNTRRSVYQKVWKSGRQYRRFFLRLIKVRYKINGIFIDVCKHLHGNLAQTCLCITHGRRAVSIHRTKVSMTVYQRISGGPVLCHINKCSIDRAVSMRMIFTHGIADDTCTFSVWLVRSVVQLDHRIQHSTLYWLKSISYIWKSTGRNNAHGIIDIGGLHGLL